MKNIIALRTELIKRFPSDIKERGPQLLFHEKPIRIINHDGYMRKRIKEEEGVLYYRIGKDETNFVPLYVETYERIIDKRIFNVFRECDSNSEIIHYNAESGVYNEVTFLNNPFGYYVLKTIYDYQNGKCIGEIKVFDGLDFLYDGEIEKGIQEMEIAIKKEIQSIRLKKILQ